MKKRDDNEMRDRLMAERPDLFKVNSQFAPKLNHAERCAVFGFYQIGIPVPVLAAAYGLNRGTVRYITNPNSPHYKDVRKEYNATPVAVFNQTYCTPAEQERIKTAKGDPAIGASDNVLKERAKGAAPSFRARGKAGPVSITHTPNLPDHPTITFDVRFCDSDPRSFDGAALPEGWYLVLDKAAGDWPPGAYGDPMDRYTSSNAVEGYLRRNEAVLAE